MKPILTKLLTLPFLFISSTASSEQSFSVALQTPTSCEHIQITEVYSDSNSAVVVAKAFKPRKDVMCMMMISNSKDSVTLKERLPKQTKVAIVGKSWCWENQNKDYVFIKSKAELDKLTQNMNKIFERPLPKSVYYQGFEAGKNCK